MKNENYMARCIQIAGNGKGKVSPNPLVGCVIVHKNRIIGEGFHPYYGGPHAEVQAVRSISKKDEGLLKASTLFVSLEPCFHYGNTPPCVDLVLEKEIPKVVIACKDPNPKVAGKSIQKLKKAGVEVISGVLESEGRELARYFFTNQEEKRTYAILKWAESQYGFMGKTGQQIWFNNSLANRWSHKLRAEHDSIFVGTQTVLTDNPNLNTRHWPGKDPVRVSVDRKGRLSSGLNILNGLQSTILFVNKNKDYPEHVRLDDGLSLHKNFSEDLLTTLWQKHKIQSVIVEGGAAMHQLFIESGMWDEIHILRTSHNLAEGIAAPKFQGKLLKRIQLSDNVLEIYNKR